jgi:hypothetical protein
MSNPRQVTCRIVFLKLGQIDTKNERYDAEGNKKNIFHFNFFICLKIDNLKAYIEISWEDDAIFKLLSDPSLSKNSNDFFSTLKN